MSAAASKAIIVPQPLKKTTQQFKDTIMTQKKKIKFSLMKTLFSNSFVCTKPKQLQEQSNSVSDHQRNAASAAAAAAAAAAEVKNKDEDEDPSSSSNKSSYNNITYEMNPYYISHKFPFYNTQMIDSRDQEEDEDDSNKPIYDEERPHKVVQRKATTTKEEIGEEKHDQLQQLRVEEEDEEEFVNPFGKDKSSLNSCFFCKSQRQRRSSCISTHNAPIC